MPSFAHRIAATAPADNRSRARRGRLVVCTSILGCLSGSPVNAQQGDVGERIGGRWLLRLQETDGVELDLRMTFAPSREGGQWRWEAYSRSGGAREMVGAGTAVLGRLLGRLPPHDALIHIGEGRAELRADTVTLRGMLVSPFLGRRTFRATVASGHMRVDLSRVPSGASAGTMTGVRDSTDVPLRDYGALAVELEHAIRVTIFDPALLEQPRFERFFQELRIRYARARDDLDAVASFQALKPSLGTSHLEFTRNPRLAALPLDSLLAAGPAADRERHVRLGFPAPDVAWLRVTKWDGAQGRVDRAFGRIDSAQARFLILDIRGNPGGDATSVAPLTHLMRDTVQVGVFLGRKWHESNRLPVRPEALASMRVLGSDTAPAQLMVDVREHGAVIGQAVPRAPYYAGGVFLLIDAGTASASEPLAHTLKASGRAIVIGERTAGAMLMALPHALSDGWVAVIPEADFIAADGVRLEGRGVEPGVKVPPDEVFLAVADRIAGAAPLSAEVLRGGTYEAMQRPRDAERAYRSALRLADQLPPTTSGPLRAVTYRRLARILAARGDSAGARREYGEVLKLIPDDVEALAAVRRGSLPR